MSLQSLVSKEFCFIGPANPFTATWVQATPNFHKVISDTYDSGPSRVITWWNITANVIGEMYLADDPLPLDRDEAGVLCQQAKNSGNRHSILKVELTYPLGNSNFRTIRFDVGSGIDILIPPTWWIKAIFLRPDAAAGEPVPAGFDRDAFFVSDLVCTARCVESPWNFPGGVWTDQLSINGPGDATRDFVVQEGAVAVSASFSAAPGGAIQFIWQRRAPDGTILDETVLGVATAAAGATTIERTSIPAGTNILRFTGTAFPVQGTITQHLEF
jgi:hypothetical protein